MCFFFLEAELFINMYRYSFIKPIIYTLSMTSLKHVADLLFHLAHSVLKALPVTCHLFPGSFATFDVRVVVKNGYLYH